MADEEVLDADESLEEDEDLDGGDEESTAEASPFSALEAKIAALEQLQRQNVNEIRSAVGRVQSLAAKLDKANDPATEVKLRSELAGVSELLGLVTDSIDESILPRDVKRRVADAQAEARAAAADAEINRRIAAATAPKQEQGYDVDGIESAVVAQIRSLGLDDSDPAFNWQQAAQILGTQGQAAMWDYFGRVERELLTKGGETPPEAGPQRRPRTTAPRSAGPTAPNDVGAQLANAVDGNDLQAGIDALRKLGVPGV